MDLTKNVNIWNLCFRVYALLFSLYGAGLSLFFIYITFSNLEEGAAPDYFFLITVPFWLIIFWFGYSAARKVTIRSIKILTVLSLLLLLNKISDFIGVIFGLTFESTSLTTAAPMLVALPVIVVLYFIMVKKVSVLILG